MRELQEAINTKNAAQEKKIHENLQNVNRQLHKYERILALESQKKMLGEKLKEPSVANDFVEYNLLLDDLRLINNELQKLHKPNSLLAE